MAYHIVIGFIEILWLACVYFRLCCKTLSYFTPDYKSIKINTVILTLNSLFNNNFQGKGVGWVGGQLKINPFILLLIKAEILLPKYSHTTNQFCATFIFHLASHDQKADVFHVLPVNEENDLSSFIRNPFDEISCDMQKFYFWKKNGCGQLERIWL